MNQWMIGGGAVLGMVLWMGSVVHSATPQPEPLKLHTRSRTAPVGQPAADVTEKLIEWDPSKTALIVIDMWDDHWCEGAARRVVEMAGPMNKVIHAARDRGVFIVHAPSSTVDFYKETPQRKRAQNAPHAKPPIQLASEPRWGTAWCWPDKQREPAQLPIDDSDMGCDCQEKCTIREAWTRQIATIDIAEEDAITDNGQELYNLLAERGIDNVIVMGVHLNMCVLGRPVAIRQLVKLGKNVVLVRDMTDTMYNSQMRPQVNHFAGTDLMIEYVEQYWCPTITSVDLVGGQPFRFQEDPRK